MKIYETLHAQLYRETFQRKEFAHLRDKLINARRFVLDAGMSHFAGLLSIRAIAEYPKDRKYAIKILEGVRILAKAPHKLTWIEFDGIEHFKAVTEVEEEKMGSDPEFSELPGTIPDGVPVREGWLIEEVGESHYRASAFFLFKDNYFGPALTSFEWTTNDFHLELPTDLMITASKSPSITERRIHTHYGVGIINHECPHIRVVKNHFTDGQNHKNLMLSIELTTGRLRTLWSLLASINDIPVEISEVRVSKGFVARGTYKKFLGHSTITLNVPKKSNLRKLAKILVAISRRRGHEVRGHFRRVGAEKTRKWIAEHVRGDATLGWVVHDYIVKHGET